MRFLKSIQQDAKLFLYIYLLLMLFRIAFLVIYAGQMGSAGVGDILTALWLGARISLKTTAFLVAFPFLFATIPYAFYSKWPVAGIRKVLGSVEISLMTFLFMARIPYYEIFHQGFNIMLFNGMKDDKWAIFDTAVQQYALWPRLLGACVLMVVFVWLWLHVAQRTNVWSPKRHVRLWVIGAVVCLPIFAIFCRFGGAFHSDDGVPWESAARTRYVVLNEAVLDDGQALYRAYITHKRVKSRANRPISDETLKQAVVCLGGDPKADSLDAACWQDLEHFTLREGFDEFHCADELPEQGESSSWGAPDGALFDVIRERMQKESEDTFYFILTTSNHPPFAYDVDAKGFPRVEVMEKLPPSIPRDKATIDQLGHIWYADQVMGKFIREVKKDDPSTLFVVTGDHAERFNFAADVSLWAQSGVPCYFYGEGVPKDLLQGAAGSHLQIAPTLAELIAPQGTTYTSLLPPLMQSKWAFNHRLFIENGEIGEEKALSNAEFKKEIEAARTVARWMVQQDR